MERFILCLIVGIFFYSFCIISWNKLLNKNINFSNYKFYLVLVLLDFFGTTINFVVPQFLKIYAMVIMFFLINYMFFCRSFSKSAITVLFSEGILVVSELIMVIILTLFIGENVYPFSETYLGIAIMNILIAAIAFIFLKFKFIYKFFDYLVKTFDNMRKSNLIIYFILTLVLISLFLIITHMKLPTTILFTCDALLTLLYLVMLFRLANARENYKSVNNKYETSLTSLKEYEEMMDRYRIANHENKNQLLSIRNMLNKKDTKTINYIDNLVDNNIKDNETIFYKTSKIPEGGLRAIIYSKLCKMKDFKIKYELDIANDVKTLDLLKIGDSTTLNTCKILGVFLDNAIEAVNKLKKKQIIIEIFVMDKSLCIDISNNYEGNIALDKLGTKKYTTKGKGHGYGLVLVNNIIKEDSNLIHETKISKELFTQRLKIKM